MKTNLGVWIGIIAGLAGFAIAITSVIVTAGQDAIWITALMLLVFGGMFYLFYRLFFKPMLNAKRLMKIGISGKAKIIDVRDTGITINNNPQVKLILEVKSSLGQRYNTHCRVLVSRINPWAYQPGMEVPVKIDPKNEMNVVIDTSSNVNNFLSAVNPATPAFNTTALTAELEQLQKENDAILLAGHSARAIVKKYNWLGINVNGNNPYVELEVEVLPAHLSSFGGKVKGVIAEASVPKFQPGEEIMVKYDYYDNSKITIEHS